MAHAFGGAIALLYRGEPRGTIDIDVNLFVGESESASILPLLESLGVSVDRTSALQAITRAAQLLVASRDSLDSGDVRSWLSRVIGRDDARSLTSPTWIPTRTCDRSGWLAWSCCRQSAMSTAALRASILSSAVSLVSRP